MYDDFCYFWFLMPLSAIFQLLYIMVTNFSGGRSRIEPPTMGNKLVNFITCGCESSAPFFVNYKNIFRKILIYMLILEHFKQLLCCNCDFSTNILKYTKHNKLWSKCTSFHTFFTIIIWIPENQLHCDKPSWISRTLANTINDQYQLQIVVPFR